MENFETHEIIFKFTFDPAMTKQKIRSVVVKEIYSKGEFRYSVIASNDKFSKNIYKNEVLEIIHNPIELYIWIKNQIKNID